ncbi:MAG: hypothetical protein HGB29_03000 [Chlorobiaceae bacterium]|nr:hypothetical protein [Chlorobiaceae bacterium]NTW73809.1 hypothetical protein [Chlorobiaceae bacterium]
MFQLPTSSRKASAVILFAISGMLTGVPSTARAEFAQAPAAYFPNLVSIALTPEGFVQPGLKLEKVAKGDLNGDTLPDLAMVIKMDDPKNLLKDPEEPERDALDTNPRMIAVALAAKSGGYTLYTVNMSLVPRLEDPYMNDPFVDLTISRGSMRLSLEQSSSAGSWSSSTIAFAFRKGPQEMELIGYDRTDVHRASGELTETSVNFLSGRQLTSTGNVSNDRKVTKVTLLPKRPLPTMGFMGDGFSFDPLNP